ncbi:unnamed protein product, partial [Amoebophrya sp. A25]|eukprot:GSA25T00016964001.1
MPFASSVKYTTEKTVGKSHKQLDEARYEQEEYRMALKVHSLSLSNPKTAAKKLAELAVIQDERDALPRTTNFNRPESSNDEGSSGSGDVRATKAAAAKLEEIKERFRTNPDRRMDKSYGKNPKLITQDKLFSAASSWSELPYHPETAAQSLVRTQRSNFMKLVFATDENETGDPDPNEKQDRGHSTCAAYEFTASKQGSLSKTQMKLDYMCLATYEAQLGNLVPGIHFPHKNV